VNVDIANSQLSRILRLALIGVATAFAWIALSLLVGLGSGYAQAAENDDDEGLLGAVTSIVDRTTSTATNTVATVTTGVAKVVNTVVSVAPAPVQKPVQQVVATVGTTVATVTRPVADASASGVVGTVTKPVVETVSQVPIVGEVASAAGLDDAVDSLTGSADDTLAGVTESVVETAAGLARPPRADGPELPALPAVPGLEGGWMVGSASPDASDFALREGLAEASGFFFSNALGRGAAVPAVGTVTPGAPADAGDPLTPAGGLCPPSAASSGPGGAGSGAWAFVALGPLAALRAWGRRAGPEDDRVPAAPAGSTDVSPD
jgi:hypothetical protein